MEYHKILRHNSVFNQYVFSKCIKINLPHDLLYDVYMIMENSLNNKEQANTTDDNYSYKENRLNIIYSKYRLSIFYSLYICL